MNSVRLKEIELSTDRPPKIVEATWNKDWFLRAEKKDMSKLKNNGWFVPDEFNELYEVFFTYGYTTSRIYTDLDGYLNLTTNKDNS